MGHNKICSVYDILHIVYAIGITIVSCLVFLDPQTFSYGFPIVFLLTAAMAENSAVYCWKYSRTKPGGKLETLLFLAVSLVFIVAAIISFITIWR